jgi:hypothetical protein
MNGPPLARIGIQDAQANQIKMQCGVLDRITWMQWEGLNPRRVLANLAKYPDPEAEAAKAAAGQDGGTKQARNKQGGSARPFSADQEGRQIQRTSGATVEEVSAETHILVWSNEADAYIPATVSRFQESSHDPAGHDKPTEAELAMAKVFITDDFLATLKAEILALPKMKEPIDPATAGEYEPGVKGIYLGIVDKQKVWAVDMRAIAIKYDSADTIVAGNSERWDFCPEDVIFVDWSFVAYDRSADLLHECTEYVLCRDGKWSYNLAHKLANYFERLFLFEIRPELKPLAGTGVTEQTEKDQTT